MRLNLRTSSGAGGVQLSMMLLVPTPAASQSSCPPAAVAALESGWISYRAGSNQSAAEQFGIAHRACPQSIDARLGLGFAQLRLGQVRFADSMFRSVLARDTSNADAWEGRARSTLRLGDTAVAVVAARKALALGPTNHDVRRLLDQISPDWDRPIAPNPRRAPNLQIPARTRGRVFEVNSGSGWQPFYIKGVNLGVALPGRFPSEFPEDSARYAGWIDTLAAMNANTLRVYTVLPPAFYRALRAWNLAHPQRLLWLIHGVWTELPPKHDFDDHTWRREFQEEMRRVVDLIHGDVNLPRRPGHAAGRYDADVSPWVLGYIVGREWEPFAVKAFDGMNRQGSYSGRYLRTRGRVPAMDVWLAQQCDFMLQYEAGKYNALRPIAYTNWPTLDPLYHPTEATTAEEARWRKRSGRPSEAKKLEYENDAVGLDATLVEPTPANPAGWFAAYHAYPYYPDFMLLDPGYRKARSAEGPSSYYGYLRDLVAYHRTIPTVIAEYGVPSSRGIAHLHHQGWSHGGHDERSMAAVDARLTREIRQAGGAGAIVFAWLDEWFKKNWAVIEYEIPLDNTRLWHNVMDAEQNYGILGLYAGDGVSTPRLGGDPSRWRALRLIQRQEQGVLRALRAGADESYLYLAVELLPRQAFWDSLGMQLALDTYHPTVGQHRLPRSSVHSEVGFEFLIDLENPTAASMRVTPEYNRHDARLDPRTGDDFGRFARRPVVTRNREDGRFDSLFIVTNRARFGRDGTLYPAKGYDRGRLRYGAESASTLSDWYFDREAGLVELRIPWDLLNVTDPSTRMLLHDARTTGTYGTLTAQDFHIGVLLYDKRASDSVLGSIPPLEGGMWRSGRFGSWNWQGWSEPRSHARLKPVYDSLRLLWQADPGGAPTPLGRRAPSN